MPSLFCCLHKSTACLKITIFIVTMDEKGFEMLCNMRRCGKFGNMVLYMYPGGFCPTPLIRLDPLK